MKRSIARERNLSGGRKVKFLGFQGWAGNFAILSASENDETFVGDFVGENFRALGRINR